MYVSRFYIYAICKYTKIIFILYISLGIQFQFKNYFQQVESFCYACRSILQEFAKNAFEVYNRTILQRLIEDIIVHDCGDKFWVRTGNLVSDTLRFQLQLST